MSTPMYPKQSPIMTNTLGRIRAKSPIHKKTKIDKLKLGIIARIKCTKFKKLTLVVDDGAEEVPMLREKIEKVRL